MTDLPDLVRHFTLQPLDGVNFGARLCLKKRAELGAGVDALASQPERLAHLLAQANGLLVVSGVQSLSSEPQLMVRISQLLGPEVEDYRETLTPQNMIHEQVPQILIVSNRPPVNLPPPARPDPALTLPGEFPVSYPHHIGWHTDQSFRRPPPDISLLYAHLPCPKGQGQTLFADATAAYETLSAELMDQANRHQGVHAILGAGRSEEAVRTGKTPKPLLPHQRSQRHPLVRVHPVTRKPALYLCQDGMGDWIEGPIAGLEPGPYGDGASFLRALLTHATQPHNVYIHDWDPGDLVIYDNRCLLHTGTWYDNDYPRCLWRTTVMGNPGKEYEGNPKSWLPREGGSPMAGLNNLQWKGDITEEAGRPD